MQCQRAAIRKQEPTTQLKGPAICGRKQYDHKQQTKLQTEGGTEHAASAIHSMSDQMYREGEKENEDISHQLDVEIGTRSGRASDAATRCQEKTKGRRIVLFISQLQIQFQLEECNNKERKTDQDICLEW